MNIKKILELHKKWLRNEDGGVRANLKDANLKGANLKGVNLSFANLSFANLKDADLSGAYLSNANFSCANLRSADFHDAYLGYADLKYAILTHANFRDTTLRHTNLNDTYLGGADLTGANLDFSQLILSCKGLDFKIDERIAKQITYHLLNLMQTSDLDINKIFKKSVYNWVNSSHLIEGYGLSKIEEK